MWKSPFITDIEYDAESKTASFSYNMLTETPTGAPLLHDTPFADDGGARDFTFVWDPVDGADSYQVTIKRVSTGKTLGVYDELNVGNVTSLKVVSVPISFWNYEIEVYVRAVKAIPCSDTSNVIRFVPKDLPKGSGNMAVGVVGEDSALISGGVGCIYAPQGSQVFDVQGHLMSSAESLPAGLYLVRYGSRTVKVLVK